MFITSKSLHRSNFVVVFDEKTFFLPESGVLMSLYEGEAAKGARFFDDANFKTKILDLPKLGLQIVLEESRLRVEDPSGQDIESTIIIKEALRMKERLFAQTPIIGFGFNFDIYFRTNNVIRHKAMFCDLFGEQNLEEYELLDFGSQFTLEKDGGKKRETYFLKITAPLELVAHFNHHFNQKDLPKESALQAMLQNCYNDSDKIIASLKT